MDLRDFIKETIIQVALGIEDAAEALKDSSAIVNPKNVLGTAGASDAKVYGYLGDANNTSRQAVQRIDFDVAVSVGSGTETKGGIGLIVGAIALGSQGKSDASSTSQSRIQFSVPMVLPTKK